MCVICDGEYDEETEELNCDNCKELKEIPELKNLIRLNCYGCSNLKEIPYLPKLEGLNCAKCPNLEIIPSLPNLSILKCWNCSSLRALPAFPSLTYLDCAFCNKLETIGNIGPKINTYNIGKIDARDCPNLRNLHISMLGERRRTEIIVLCVRNCRCFLTPPGSLRTYSSDATGCCWLNTGYNWQLSRDLEDLKKIQRVWRRFLLRLRKKKRTLLENYLGSVSELVVNSLN